MSTGWWEGAEARTNAFPHRPCCCPIVGVGVTEGGWHDVRVVEADDVADLVSSLTHAHTQTRTHAYTHTRRQTHKHTRTQTHKHTRVRREERW